MGKEMIAALKADGEKLKALTGEDHGPIWIDEASYLTGDEWDFLDDYTRKEPTDGA